MSLESDDRKRESIDRVCDEFEAAWLAGQAPLIEDFLQRADDASCPHLLRELLLAEWDLRARREQVVLEEYGQRFATRQPQLRTWFAEWSREQQSRKQQQESSEAFEASGDDATVDYRSGNEEVTNYDQAGRQFAEYELLEQIGRGGMGIVYRARQHHPKRTVALKMIRAGQFASEEAVHRFRIEAESAANTTHDGIVPVYEVGEHEGQHYYTMKLVEGRSLADCLDNDELSIEELLRLVRDVCRAMAHCHRMGIVHRDLKPSNILIDDSGHPQVLDFGLAKFGELGSDLTLDGDILGTPGYMPPEQAQGQAATVSPTADIYSLGAILYRILTDRPPLQADDVNLAGAIQLILEHDVVPPRAIDRRIPRPLNTICNKCLQADPGLRYQDADDLADDLERYLDGEQIQAVPPNLPLRFARWARQHPGLAATWLALGLFYAYHLVNYFVRIDEVSAGFHYTATVAGIAWAFGAWLCQRGLIRSGGSVRYLYYWTTLEFVMVTLLISAGHGAKSSLAVLYHVLVAGSVLRFRVRLVIYATSLALVGYLLQILRAWLFARQYLPTAGEAIPFVFSLLTLGMIQHLAMRRSRAAYELKRRKYIPGPRHTR